MSKLKVYGTSLIGGFVLGLFFDVMYKMGIKEGHENGYSEGLVEGYLSKCKLDEFLKKDE